MADYWLKLYIEILDDPKMATMPDRVWRRTIELFLVAKRMNKDGHLPDTRQVAWLLRMSADELEHDLRQIASTGIIEQEVGGWFIPNFSKRQAAVGDAERKAQERARKQSQQYYDDVTSQSRNVTQRTEDRRQSTEAETETKAEAEQSARDPFSTMQSTIERLTGYPANPKDMASIEEFVKTGVIEADIKAAVAFFASISKTARGAADLRNSVMTAKGKRIQGGTRKVEQYVGLNGEVIEL